MFYTSVQASSESVTNAKLKEIAPIIKEEAKAVSLPVANQSVFDAVEKKDMNKGWIIVKRFMED